jgi:hypothetical protein
LVAFGIRLIPERERIGGFGVQKPMFVKLRPCIFFVDGSTCQADPVSVPIAGL